MDHKITCHGISEMFCAKPIETSIKQKLLSSMISRTSTILWLQINRKQEITRLYPPFHPQRHHQHWLDLSDQQCLLLLQAPPPALDGHEASQAVLQPRLLELYWTKADHQLCQKTGKNQTGWEYSRICSDKLHPSEKDNDCSLSESEANTISRNTKFILWLEKTVWIFQCCPLLLQDHLWPCRTWQPRLQCLCLARAKVLPSGLLFSNILLIALASDILYRKINIVLFTLFSLN